MKQMGADDLLRRQLENPLRLNLSATDVFVNFMRIVHLFYYYKHNTHYIDDIRTQYIRTDFLPPPYL